MYLEALASGGGSDWFYTVILKAPLGSAITLDDNDEEVNAVGTGDYIGIPVHNASSTYAITVEANGFQRTGSVTSGATSGGMSSLLDYSFGEIDLTIDTEFNGQNATVTDGTSTATVALPATGTSAVIYVPNTGNWTISATDPVSGNTFNSSPNPVPVLAIGTPVTAGLYVIPDGSTVTPTDDIATWLLCADIKNVSYNTLEEVLADEDVLRRLLTSDNANDYLVRSKTWSVNPGLVPTMLGPTVPSGEASADSEHSSPYAGWVAFDPTDTTHGWIARADSNHIYYANDWLKYEFDAPAIVKRAVIGKIDAAVAINSFTFKIQGSNDDFVSDINDLCATQSTAEGALNSTTYTYVNLVNNTSYKYYRLLIMTDSVNSNGYGIKLQFYGFHESIPENAKAMEIIGQDDYAANTLLADSDWGQAILDSEYVNSVMNLRVPVKSANDASILYSTEYNSTYKAYCAFNEDWDKSMEWGATGFLPWCSNSQANEYIGYDFGKDVNVGFFKLRGVTYNNVEKGVSSAKIQYSDVGGSTASNWSDATDVFNPDLTQEYEGVINANVGAHRYWRLYVTASTSHQNIAVSNLQLFDRVASGVQTLLKAAGITNKPYLTIEEVLADHETVQKIMHSHDAVDYLATAKLFIDAVTSDAFAMRCIGLRNYAADTLLADSDWLDAIIGSDYKDFVFNIEVPAMTSATDPEGTVFANSYFGGYYPYKAFTGENDSAGWKCVDQSYQIRTGDNIGYTFPSQVKCYSVSARLKRQSSAAQVGGKIQGSNDGFVSDINDVSDEFTLTATANDPWYSFPFTKNIDEYDSYRFICTTPQLSGSNNYGLKLQFYGRKDVDETKIQVYSAANDNGIAIQDPSTGSLIPLCATDSLGHAEITKVTDISNGQQTLYSGVAKNPNKLTDDYFKRVNIDDWTSIIELMPDDALYWYGYESPDLEDCTTANGWASYSSSYPLNDPVHNTQDITVGSPSGKTCGISHHESSIADKVSLGEAVLQGVTIAGSDYGWLTCLNTEKIVGGSGTAVDKTISVLTNTDSKYSVPVSTGKSILCNSGNSRYMKVKAFNLYKKAQHPTFLSAANDVLYILDGARQIPIAITNAEGKSYDPMLQPGTYKIYSSVAKDPDSPSDPYSKTVTITADTVCVPVMPNGAVKNGYWYGYFGNEYAFEDGTSANGWSFSGFTLDVPTYNLNDITFPSASSHIVAIGSKNIIKGKTIKMMFEPITVSNNACMDAYYSLNTKNLRDSSTTTERLDITSGVHLYTKSVSDDRYIYFETDGGRNNKVYAFWLEDTP